MHAKTSGRGCHSRAQPAPAATTDLHLADGGSHRPADPVAHGRASRLRTVGVGGAKMAARRDRHPTDPSAACAAGEALPALDRRRVASRAKTTHSRHAAPDAAGPRQHSPLAQSQLMVHEPPSCGARTTHAPLRHWSPADPHCFISQLHEPHVGADVTHTLCYGGSMVGRRRKSPKSGLHWSSLVQVAFLGGPRVLTRAPSARNVRQVTDTLAAGGIVSVARGAHWPLTGAP